MITLYSKNGTIKQESIKKFAYSGKFMGECFLNIPFSSFETIDFEIDDYVMFRGEQFILSYNPAKKKQAKRGSYGKAFEYDNVKFNSLADELTRVEFIDVVKPDNNIHYTSQPTFSFYASSVQDLADRIQANLDLEFTGQKKWTVIVSPDAISKDMSIDVSNLTIWDAVALSNTKFGLNFIIRNRTITIGTAGLAVGKVFGYGKGNGLYDIQQTTNQDAKIITRLRAYGSTRNMPRRYYNELKDSNGQPYILESAHIPNLMLPSFPYQENDPRKVYLDSDNKSKYGIRYGSVYFDSEENEIYPSIEGMTREQLALAGITVSLPQGDNGIINEILGADNPADDGLIPDEGKGSIQGQFKLYLKDLGFDLTEKDEDGQYKYATSDTMQISMKSGMCIGRTFDVVENGITKDTSLGYVRYIVECNRFEDDSIGMAYPNKDWQIKSGDSFVILGIAMPDVYVKAASERLKVAAEEYLSENDETKYTYQPTISPQFMAHNPQLGETIKEGDIFTFKDDDLQIDASEIIQTLNIDYDLEKSPIPEYKVSLSNDKIAGRLEKMQNSINSLMSNGTGITLNQVKSLINSIGSSLFLSKNFDDIARGLIKFVRGIDIGDYTQGAFGSGGTFRMRDGSSELEVDKLTVRKWARFFEVIIERMSHIGADVVLSPARMVCSKVEELDKVYRCYFDTGENDEFVQEFVVNDQARCQVFTGSTQKHYWRLVEGIGKDYIDLSKTDFDSGSDIPTESDHIFQLGNRDNIERQNAQILSSFGADAPSFKQYQGINSYSLEGKEKTVISPSGNFTDAVVKIQAGSLGWENLVGLPEQFQGLATGAVNLIRNSGFTGEYTSIELREDTQLRPETEMFSERLAHWDGFATISEDSESISGYSATLLNQEISQVVPTIFDENYVLSLKAKGRDIKIDVSGYTENISLTSEYSEYTIKLKSSDTKLFKLQGNCTICDIQLERGTIKSDYSASPLDNDKTLAQFNEIRYITDSVRNGSTSILGGLILSSMIQLGNYVNGNLKAVTAGMSGIYNSDEDVAFWAGGELNKAIANTVDPFTTNPNHMINFLVTHGGMLIANEAIIRGWIYADGGKIGQIEIDKVGIHSSKKDKAGKPLFSLNGNDGSGWFAGGGISWDELGDLIVTGKFESNKDGVRIVIDPKDRSLKMMQDDEVIVDLKLLNLNGSLSPYLMFDYTSDSTIGRLYTLLGSGELYFSGRGLSSIFMNNGFQLTNNNSSSIKDQVAYMLLDSAGELRIKLDNLPENDINLEPGRIWRDGTYLRIVE